MVASPSGVDRSDGAPGCGRWRDTIVLADFNNKTGDPVFDDTLKEGLAIQLEQSPFELWYAFCNHLIHRRR